MIDIIITSYNEPNATLKAVQHFLNQKIKNEFRITIVDPFPEVEKFIRSKVKDKRVKFFLDPGEGKAYALNLLFQEYGSKNKEDIFILSDGDVYVSRNSVNEILREFRNKKVGCVTGRPISIDARNTKYGYFSHLFFDGIHKVRKKLNSKNIFFECSGYLFALRKGVIYDFPAETSEDSIIPYLFWKKGYSIRYCEKAEVYVKNPSNLKDWLNQKVRNVLAHENLNRLAPEMPRTKTFYNEVKWGTIFALTYSKNTKEFLWTLEAFLYRFYLYLLAFKRKRQKKKYRDGWREVEIKSTKTLD